MKIIETEIVGGKDTTFRRKLDRLEEQLKFEQFNYGNEK